MSLAVVYSRGCSGIDAPLVTVEVHVTNGLPTLNIVGLPETAVKESKDRVRGAILNSYFEFPIQRITINLAPADLPKEGGRFDLAIALGILAASKQISKDKLTEYECIGELSLSGELRPINGVLPVAIQARNAGRKLILPKENSTEAILAKQVKLLPSSCLLEVCAHINEKKLLTIYVPDAVKKTNEYEVDFSDVQGQYQAKRAFEIAASGLHNLLMLGPPGTGKSMLASRFPTIMPELTEEQAQETAAIASISNLGLNVAKWLSIPFRTPHHTASAVALVGGGNNPKPGEISLAHNGVLFLDELPEFNRQVLEVLRSPLETGQVSISRARKQVSYPAKFQLIAAMNPCPCGYLGDESGRCHCTLGQIIKYKAKISGPLLDRIDIHLEVLRVPHKILSQDLPQGEETSATIRDRVVAARNFAKFRQGKVNSELLTKEIKQFCSLSIEGDKILEQAMSKFGWSNRAYHRILKLSRTIADLAQAEKIEITHLSEAISYRQLDRKTYS